jgi:hypothetical protein
MHIGRWVCGLALALVASVVLLPSLASAQVISERAIASTNLNMREGPGAEHPVVSVLLAGDAVSVLRCIGTWCLVEFGRNEGWVSQSFLQPLLASAGDLETTIGTGNPTGPGRACFFEQANFRGPSFCARQGESERDLGNWENRIVSVMVEGRATVVDLCEERNFGDCSSFTGNVPMLDIVLQQNVSSLRVR